MTIGEIIDEAETLKQPQYNSKRIGQQYSDDLIGIALSGLMDNVDTLESLESEYQKFIRKLEEDVFNG